MLDPASEDSGLQNKINASIGVPMHIITKFAIVSSPVCAKWWKVALTIAILIIVHTSVNINFKALIIGSLLPSPSSAGGPPTAIDEAQGVVPHCIDHALQLNRVSSRPQSVY